jgi:hypothetical protein
MPKPTTQPKYPHLIQPKDRNHELYALIKEFMASGDKKVIAVELGVQESVVSQVSRGFCRSKRIWQKIIETVMLRKEQQDSFMAYMKKPLPHISA